MLSSSQKGGRNHDRLLSRKERDGTSIKSPRKKVRVSKASANGGRETEEEAVRGKRGKEGNGRNKEEEKREGKNEEAEKTGDGREGWKQTMSDFDHNDSYGKVMREWLEGFSAFRSYNELIEHLKPCLASDEIAYEDGFAHFRYTPTTALSAIQNLVRLPAAPPSATTAEPNKTCEKEKYVINAADSESVKEWGFPSFLSPISNRCKALVEEETFGSVIEALIPAEDLYSDPLFLYALASRLDASKSSAALLDALASHDQKGGAQTAQKECIKMFEAQEYAKSDAMRMRHALPTYKSILHTGADFLCNEDLRRETCIHVFRHIVAVQSQRFLDQGDKPAARTLGWTRPRVLIVTPTRFHAKQWIEHFLALTGTSSSAENLDRFQEEFYAFDDLGALDPEAELGLEMIETKSRSRKPLDFIEAFRGNNDDNFRLGLRMTFKFSSHKAEGEVDETGEGKGSPLGAEVKLFSSFYNSDIIIGSSLGMRLIVGSEGDKDGDFDFLSSLEILVVDRFDLMAKQNLDHLHRTLSCLNRRPLYPPKTADISKMRMCHFSHKKEDLSRFYRQNIFLGKDLNLTAEALQQRFDANYRGYLLLSRPPPKIPFHLSLLSRDLRATVLVVGPRKAAATTGDAAGNQGRATASGDVLLDTFNEHFIQNFYPKIQAEATMIVVPSWLEYKEVARLMKKGLSTDRFLNLHERTKDTKVVSVRQQFRERKLPLLLVTERFLHFRRLKLGSDRPRTIVFLGPPSNPDILLDFLRPRSGTGRQGERAREGDEDEENQSQGRGANALLIYWQPEEHIDCMHRLLGDPAKLQKLVSKTQNGRMVALDLPVS